VASRLLLPGLLAGTALGILAADGRWLPSAAPLPLIVLAVGAGLVSHAVPNGTTLLVAALALGGAIGFARDGAATLPTGPGSVAALVATGERSLRGTLTDDARPRGERLQLVLDEVSVLDDGRWKPAAGRLLVWLPRSSSYASGDRLALSASLETPRDFDGFAYRAYLARQGIGAIARSYQAALIGHRLDPLSEAMAGLRHLLLDGIDRLIPEPEAALGAGILLGVRSGIDPEVGDAFARAGLTHVVAISGWNIAIVAALIAALLRPAARLRGGRRLVPAATIGAIAAYVLLTGASPSVVRAALMAGAMLISRLGGSRTAAASALMLAALLMLVAAPPVIWDVGFQLSLLATAGLIWFGAATEARLAFLPAALREPVALTLAAQLTTLPIVLASFERLSLVAPLANVVVVPLVPLVMLLSAVAAAVGAVIGAVHVPILPDALAWLAGGSAWLYLRLMIAAGAAAASVPFASIDVTPPGWLPAAWYAGLAVTWLRLRHRRDPDPAQIELRPGQPRRRTRIPGRSVLRGLLRPRSLALITVAALLSITIASWPDGRLHLEMLDIGQGDAILVVGPDGRSLLIDGGPDPDLTLRRLGEQFPFDRRRIDLLLLTHPHQDHVAGLVEVLRRYSVGTVLDGRRAVDNPTYATFRALARNEPGGRTVTARAGARYAIGGGANLELLYPTAADAAAPLPDDDINNASVVARLSFGGFAALLTGDAELPVEARLIERGSLTPVDVLKVGHHGSRSSTSAALLAATQPSVALISVGAGNDYGHPAPTTLAALQARRGLSVFRTDRDGTVAVVTDGWTFSVTTRAGSGAVRHVHGIGAVGLLTATATAGTGSIWRWPSPDSIRLANSSPRWSCPMAWWSTPRGWSASPPRPRGWSARLGFPSTSASSRSPPCCTTSTSRRRVTRRSSTGWPPRDASVRWASRSWPCRSPRIPSSAS
jgi:competence protein ComEC